MPHIVSSRACIVPCVPTFQALQAHNLRPGAILAPGRRDFSRRTSYIHSETSLNDARPCLLGPMHTGDWWWDKQVSTLYNAHNGVDTSPLVTRWAPMAFMSDATHLTNFSGDKEGMANIRDDRQPISSPMDEAHHAQCVVGRPFANCHQDARCPLVNKYSVRETTGTVPQTYCSMCCIPYSILTLASSMPAVPMATSGIVIRHWLHGWQIIPKDRDLHNTSIRCDA